MTPLPDLVKTRFPARTQTIEVPGLQEGEVNTSLGAPGVCNSPCLPVDRGAVAEGEPTRLTVGYTGIFCHLGPGLPGSLLGAGGLVRKIKAGETM